MVPAAYPRRLPSWEERMRLAAVDAEGERVVGDYRFNHHAVV